MKADVHHKDSSGSEESGKNEGAIALPSSSRDSLRSSGRPPKPARNKSRTDSNAPPKPARSKTRNEISVSRSHKRNNATGEFS